MTKDEAKDDIFWCRNGMSYIEQHKDGLADSIYILRSDIFKFIDRIYDDIEKNEVETICKNKNFNGGNR